jgi:hypothetical protein
MILVPCFIFQVNPDWKHCLEKPIFIANGYLEDCGFSEKVFPEQTAISVKLGENPLLNYNYPSSFLRSPEFLFTILQHQPDCV